MTVIDGVVARLKVRFAKEPEKERARLLLKQGVRIGSGCMVFSDVGVGSEPYLISIGNNVKITSGVRFITHDGGMHVLRGIDEAFAQADLFGEIRVGDNVFIGVNTIVLPGVSIGDNVVVGAGSVVVRDIPSNSVAAGVPCRVVKSLGEYKESTRPRVVPTKGWTAADKRDFLTARRPPRRVEMDEP